MINPTVDSLCLVLNELVKQRKKGYVPDHDFRYYHNGELLVAAEAVIEGDSSKWPWPIETFPVRDDKLHELAVAASLIVAEMNRITLVQVEALRRNTPGG